jgi:signal peptidase I
MAESAANPAGDPKSETGKDKPDSKPARASNPYVVRETLESIIVAFILAFLFRAFVAEAFVIPTGSMAPTLMGAHKDTVCEHCGALYQSTASYEYDSENRNSLTTRQLAAPAPYAGPPMPLI